MQGMWQGGRRRRGATTMLAAVAAIACGVVFPTAAVAADDPDHVSFTLEGCRNDGTITLPDAGGKFICPDSAYTTGNLGKGWNELDLVPYRLIADAGGSAPATQTYTMAIVLDAEDAGAPGYDVLSAPTLNTLLSDPGCQAPVVGPDTILSPGLGGIDESRYRLLTITQPANTECVYDYFGRLALGSHLFPGSSLHANKANQNLTTAGIGAADVSIPVKEILPQEIEKDMSASQDANHAWDIRKSPTPATVSFANTCDPQAARTAGVSVQISWTRNPATPDGPITVITHVYATNPAARVITVTVSDAIRSGTTVLDVANSGAVDVPANTANFLVLTHTITVPNGTTNLNDIATATYTDKVTGIPVPGSTTATASAAVQPSGNASNSSATVTDTESITAPFQFSADSFSGASGSFDAPYVPGTFTNGPVGWTSATQSGSGSVTFLKTVRTPAATSASGTLSDTATLTTSGSVTSTATANVGVSSSASVTLTITKNISGNILQAGESQAFTFRVKDAADNEVAAPTITLSAGETTKSVNVAGLVPGVYTVSEDPVTGWTTGDPQTADLRLPTCAATVTFNNRFAPANARAIKITDPAGQEAGWQMTLTGPGTPVAGETVATDAAGLAPFTTVLQEGSYTITEAVKPGWDPVSATGDCSFTVDYPADNDRTFTCTFTNRQRGHIIVVKQTTPDGSSQPFEFDPSWGANFFLTDGQSNDSGALVAGTYSVAEVNIPAGWDLTSATCSDGSAVNSISLQAGETVTCTFNDRQRGKAQVVKTVSGQPPSGTQAFTFQLRQGASVTQSGTILETLVANAGNGGILNFTTFLVPGQTYQMCEIVMPGWSSTLGTFVPDSFLPPDGVAPNPNVDNSIVCVNFTVAAGETKVFTVDNTPPPGGRALTIGFWKNHASCKSSNGGQDAVLDQILASFPIAAGQTTHGVFIGILYVDTCAEAVALLDKRDRITGKKMSSDPAYNLAAQLMATELNFQAGAGKCPEAITAEMQAQILLSKYLFDGTGSYTSGPKKFSKADATLANQLAHTLDLYNNNLLCGQP